MAAGESSEGLVLGDGRPFYAEITEPKVRHLELKKICKTRGRVVLKEIKLIDIKPKKIPDFIVLVKTRVKLEQELSINKIN